MSRTAAVYDVLIASPSDVKAERLTVQEVIQAWNSTHSADSGAVLLPVTWETHATPTLGDRPQAILNKQIVENADILVGIFWTRLGTPTGQAESGSVEEIEEFLAKGKPVLLYFSSVPVIPDSVDPEQYRKLKEFKESIRNQGLVFDFQSILELRDMLYRHLNKTVHDLQSKKPEQPPPASGGRVGPRHGPSQPEPPSRALDSSIRAPGSSHQMSALMQAYDSFARRLEVEWKSERDSGTLTTDGGKLILDRARQTLLDFRSDPRVAENVQLAAQIDKIIRNITALQQHRVYLDGGKSFREFWEAGNAIISEITAAKELIGITEDRSAPLRQHADHDIGLALMSNAEDRTYIIVGAMVLRKKQEDRWTTTEVEALKKALYSGVSSRRVNVRTAASTVVAETEDENQDLFMRVSFSASGVATFVFGWREDPFPVPLAIAVLLAGVRMFLSKEFLEAYDPIAPMEVTLGVVNWPEHGMSVGNLWGLAKPQPIGSLKGRRVSRKFSLAPDALPWTIVGPFLAYLLADAGFIDYERYIAQPPPYAVLVDYLANTGLSLT